MSRHAHSLDALLAKLDDRGLVKGRTLREVVRTLKRVIPVAGKNITGRESPDGIVLSGHAGGGAAACPFDGAATGGLFQFINAGLLNGLLPSNMFSAGELFSTALPTSGNKWVTLDVTASDNVPTGVAITTSTSAPTPPGVGEGTAPASFMIPLFLLSADQAFKLVGCGALTATPYQVLTSDREPSVCGGDPLVRHYSWRW